MTRTLLIFAKQPVAGFVKTRLAKNIGPQQAAEVAVQLFNIVFNTAIRFSKQSFIETKIVLVVSPCPDKCFWDKYRQMPNVAVEKQVDGDLGARMWHAVEPRLKQGHQVICIGMDCPYLTSEDFEAAFVSLEHNSVVVHPAFDGGYVLLGLVSSSLKQVATLKGLFTGMPWSSPTLLQSTLVFIRRNSFSYQLMRKLSDIDEIEDLHEWQATHG